VTATRHDWSALASAAAAFAGAARGREGVRSAPGGADRIARMQEFVDCAWQALARSGVSWIGFYIDVSGATDEERLVLGPRRDTPACSPIGLHGACGRCLLSGAPLVVRDVKELGPNYIACDPRDRSELVLPCRAGGTVWGVLDVDSHEVGCFSEADAKAATEALVAWSLDDRVR
jgi:putative methionine-R-sulfoxide reductase with GAF domain